MLCGMPVLAVTRWVYSAVCRFGCKWQAYTHPVRDGAYADRCRLLVSAWRPAFCCVVLKAKEGWQSEYGLWAVKGVCRDWRFEWCNSILNGHSLVWMRAFAGWLGASKPSPPGNRQCSHRNWAPTLILVPMCTITLRFGYTEIRKIPGWSCQRSYACLKD